MLVNLRKLKINLEHYKIPYINPKKHFNLPSKYSCKNWNDRYVILFFDFCCEWKKTFSDIDIKKIFQIEIKETNWEVSIKLNVEIFLI